MFGKLCFNLESWRVGVTIILPAGCEIEEGEKLARNEAFGVWPVQGI